MGHIGYYRSRRGWRRIKGFRVNSGRLSVHRLRIRFLDFISFLRRWKRVCDRALNSLKKGIRNRNDNSVSSKRGLVADRRRPNGPDYKLRAYGRSNSFYAEAIADCLEFIKRSALVMDDDGPTNNGRITHTEGSWHASHEAVRITHHYVAGEMHAEREIGLQDVEDRVNELAVVKCSLAVLRRGRGRLPADARQESFSRNIWRSPPRCL